MADALESSLPSTPESVKAIAQSHEGLSIEAAAVNPGTCAGEETAFAIGDVVGRAMAGPVGSPFRGQ